MQDQSCSTIPAVSPHVFLFDSSEVRTLLIDGDPWFVAADVATVLGYEKPRNAVAAHCKGALKRGVLTNGGNQDMTIIPERDVYRLVMRSKLPSAEKFEEWVVGEVLPSIRKTGSYSSAPAPVASALSPAKEYRALFGIARLIGLDKNHAAFSANTAVRKITGVDMLGLLGTTHLVSENPVQHFNVTELGSRLGISAQVLNRKLKDAGLQESKNGHWVATDKGMDYAVLLDTTKRHGNGTPILQLRWRENVLSALGGAA